MAIDDHSSLAFELILQSSALNEKLLSKQSNAVAGNHSMDLLVRLAQCHDDQNSRDDLHHCEKNETHEKLLSFLIGGCN